MKVVRMLKLALSCNIVCFCEPPKHRQSEKEHVAF